MASSDYSKQWKDLERRSNIMDVPPRRESLHKYNVLAKNGYKPAGKIPKDVISTDVTQMDNLSVLKTRFSADSGFGQSPSGKGEESTLVSTLKPDIESHLSHTTKVGNQFSGNDKMVFGKVGPEGGTLTRSDPTSGRPIQLIIGRGALDEPTTIYMVVEASEFSPRIQLRPSGTTFRKPVRLIFPVQDSTVPLSLRKRENEQSEWREDPDNTPYIEHDGICAMEMSSFSYYEMAPTDALGVKIMVYTQETTTQTGLCLRVYLAKDSNIQNIGDLEEGFRGVLVERQIVYVHDRAIILLGECLGLTSLDSDNIRNVTRDVLAKDTEFGTAFVFKYNTNVNMRKVKVIIMRSQFKPLTYNIEVSRARDNFSPEQSALASVYSNFKPIEQPIALFPLCMTETLVDLLNPMIGAVYALAENIGLPRSTPIPEGNLINYGGSAARFVLDYYQYLCVEQAIENEEGLKALKGQLKSVGLEEAAEVIDQYIHEVSCEAQESEDLAELDSPPVGNDLNQLPFETKLSTNQISYTKSSSVQTFKTKPSSNQTSDTKPSSVETLDTKPSPNQTSGALMVDEKGTDDVVEQRIIKRRNPDGQKDSAYISGIVEGNTEEDSVTSESDLLL